MTTTSMSNSDWGDALKGSLLQSWHIWSAFLLTLVAWLAAGKAVWIMHANAHLFLALLPITLFIPLFLIWTLTRAVSAVLVARKHEGDSTLADTAHSRLQHHILYAAIFSALLWTVIAFVE